MLPNEKCGDKSCTSVNSRLILVVQSFASSLDVLEAIHLEMLSLQISVLVSLATEGHMNSKGLGLDNLLFVPAIVYMMLCCS